MDQSSQPIPTPEANPAPVVPEVASPPTGEVKPAPAPAETAPQAPLVPPAPLPAPAPAVPTDPAAAPTPAPTAGPQIADDVDVIEKEWVDAAEKVVRDNPDDPYKEEEAFETLQVDYLQKRYGKDITKKDGS